VCTGAVVRQFKAACEKRRRKEEEEREKVAKEGAAELGGLLTA
jgi:hypothetical protein